MPPRRVTCERTPFATANTETLRLNCSDDLAGHTSSQKCWHHSLPLLVPPRTLTQSQRLLQRRSLPHLKLVQPRRASPIAHLAYSIHRHRSGLRIRPQVGTRPYQQCLVHRRPSLLHPRPPCSSTCIADPLSTPTPGPTAHGHHPGGHTYACGRVTCGHPDQHECGPSAVVRLAGHDGLNGLQEEHSAKGHGHVCV